MYIWLEFKLINADLLILVRTILFNLQVKGNQEDICDRTTVTQLVHKEGLKAQMLHNVQAFKSWGFKHRRATEKEKVTRQKDEQRR